MFYSPFYVMKNFFLRLPSGKHRQPDQGKNQTFRPWNLIGKRGQFSLSGKYTVNSVFKALNGILYSLLLYGIPTAAQPQRYFPTRCLCRNLFICQISQYLSLIFSCVILSYAKFRQSGKKLAEGLGFSSSSKGTGCSSVFFCFPNFFILT